MNVDPFRLLARYNAHANAEMNQVLAGLPVSEWDRDQGGYFPSFRALTGHIYTVDVVWLLRFNGLRPFQTVQGEPFDNPPWFDKLPFGDFDEYARLRAVADAKWSAFVEELTDDDLAADVTYKDSKGKAYTKNFGGLLLHVFNHQTHHRGQISLLLDQAKVANDYSSISPLL